MHKVENLLCNIFDGGTVRVYFRFQDTGRAMLARHMAVKDDRFCAPNWSAFWARNV